MSLKSILKDIGNFICNAWNSLKPKMKKIIDIGVTVTNGIKNWDDKNGGFIDAITAVIPGHADDAIVAKIREKLPVILVQMRLVQATETLTDPKEITDAAIKILQQLGGDYRVAAFNELAAHIAVIAADGKIDFKDATYLIDYYYKNQHNPKVDTSLD